MNIIWKGYALILYQKFHLQKNIYVIMYTNITYTQTHHVHMLFW